MSSNSEELFESLTQPLRAAQIDNVGMTMGDVQLLEESEKIPFKVEVKLRPKKEGHIQIQEKMGELITLEISHLEFMKKVLEVLSDEEFQAIFSDNETERKIIWGLAEQLKVYFEFHNKNIKKPLEEVEKDLRQIGVLYSHALLSVQKTLIMAFPRLFSLGQIFTNERNCKKITALMTRKFQAIKDADPHKIIETGQLSTTFMQTITRRTMLLEELYRATAEHDPSHSEIIRVYTSLAEQSWEANHVMDGAKVISRQVNQDLFCLRKVLYDDECFQELRKMAAKDSEKVEALDFLRELSILIQENDFLENTPAANKFTFLKLGFSVDSDRKFKQLAEGPVPRNLAKIYPLLKEFVNSPFFIEKARLLKYPNETEDDYQERLKRLAVRGELIRLYQQQSVKEEKREENVKEEEERKRGSAEGQSTFEVVLGTVSELSRRAGERNFVPSEGEQEKVREEIVEGKSEEGKEENISSPPPNEMRDQDIFIMDKVLPQGSPSTFRETGAPELPEVVDERKVVPLSVVIEEKQKESKEQNLYSSQSDERRDQGTGESLRQRDTFTTCVETASEQPGAEGGLSVAAPEEEQENIEEMKIIESGSDDSDPMQTVNFDSNDSLAGVHSQVSSVDSQAGSLSNEPPVSSNLVVQYLGIAAKMMGDFVYEDPATAVTFALVCCMAVGIGIASCGAGIVVAAAVAAGLFFGLGGAGLWCGFFSDSASRLERTQKQSSSTENMVPRDWMAYRLMGGGGFI